jgi:NAD(P)H-hydrate epimerase
MEFTNKNNLKLPPRDPNSKKGDFGKIIVVGGSSSYYGSPILTACGAEYSGADLITLYLPSMYKDTAKNYSLNFFIKDFQEDVLTKLDVRKIIDDTTHNHVLVIGNGIGKAKETKQAVLEILSNVTIPVVIDAESLFPEILKIKPINAQWIITPHKTEYERLFEVEFDEKSISKIAQHHNITILAKCGVNYIADGIGRVIANNTGCAEMRVGGTGDVLAGITGSFIAQGLKPFDAACSAAYFWGKCGTIMSQKSKWLTAYDMIKNFPKIAIEIDLPTN